MAWKFTSNGKLFIITTTWANNNSILPYPKAKFNNSIWKLSLRPKLQLFTLKLVHEILPTRYKLRHFGINIDDEWHFCNKDEENIDHIFMKCDLVFNFGLLLIIIVLPLSFQTSQLRSGLKTLGHTKIGKMFGNPLKKLITIL